MRKKPLQQRSRVMVASIIDACARVIGEEGLDALTTNRVAEVAGISNGSLYQYFHDREDLLEAVTGRMSEQVMALLTANKPDLQLEQVDMRSRMYVLLRIVLDFVRGNPLYLELVRNWARVPLHTFLDPMERYLLQETQQYLVRHAAGQTVPDLQARFYLQFNSAFFNLLRFASEENPYVREDELLRVMADNIEQTFIGSARRGA